MHRSLDQREIVWFWRIASAVETTVGLVEGTDRKKEASGDVIEEQRSSAQANPTELGTKRYVKMAVAGFKAEEKHNNQTKGAQGRTGNESVIQLSGVMIKNLILRLKPLAETGELPRILQ
ncbi:MAG TPA: hypothetical protein VKC60_18560 [Opitutaceae bacterium]|nr:hypothetical protein [Opitutaceae bacterium]